MSAPIVFFDIAGPDSLKLGAFYETVFGWHSGKTDGFVAGNPPDIGGAFRQDPAEKVIYIGVANITSTLALIEESGGTIDTPRFEVPSQVILGLFRDPAGNRMGLVELEGDEIKVP